MLHLDLPFKNVVCTRWCLKKLKLPRTRSKDGKRPEISEELFADPEFPNFIRGYCTWYSWLYSHRSNHDHFSFPFHGFLEVTHPWGTFFRLLVCGAICFRLKRVIESLLSKKTCHLVSMPHGNSFCQIEQPQHLAIQSWVSQKNKRLNYCNIVTHWEIWNEL